MKKPHAVLSSLEVIGFAYHSGLEVAEKQDDTPAQGGLPPDLDPDEVVHGFPKGHLILRIPGTQYVFRAVVPPEAAKRIAGESLPLPVNERGVVPSQA